jgi:hypothetical protein
MMGEEAQVSAGIPKRWRGKGQLPEELLDESKRWIFVNFLPGLASDESRKVEKLGEGQGIPGRGSSKGSGKSASMWQSVRA